MKKAGCELAGAIVPLAPNHALASRDFLYRMETGESAANRQKSNLASTIFLLQRASLILYAM
jgi:hypothetical protein